MNHDIRMLPISTIKIGDRHRKDLGDLDSLAASIERGLLQSIGVTPKAAAELAGTVPEAQRRVLAELKDETGWAVRGVRKSLNRAKRRMAIERTHGWQIEPPDEDDIRLYHGPFQKLEEIAVIAPSSVNLILTDIPFGPEFLPEVRDLGAFAARVLVKGGLLVTYSGILYLNQVIRSLDEHLTWSWSAASVWMGDASMTRYRNVVGKWKPILIYSKGGWQEWRQWPDVLMVNSKEKDWHDRQQPLEEVECLVRYFSEPGALVVDTCGGGFTTALACKRLGRRGISCDIDETAVIRGQARLAEETPVLAVGS